MKPTGICCARGTARPDCYDFFATALNKERVGKSGRDGRWPQSGGWWVHGRMQSSVGEPGELTETRKVYEAPLFTDYWNPSKPWGLHQTNYTARNAHVSSSLHYIRRYSRIPSNLPASTRDFLAVTLLPSLTAKLSIDLPACQSQCHLALSSRSQRCRTASNPLNTPPNLQASSPFENK